MRIIEKAANRSRGPTLYLVVLIATLITLTGKMENAFSLYRRGAAEFHEDRSHFAGD